LHYIAALGTWNGQPLAIAGSDTTGVELYQPGGWIDYGDIASVDIPITFLYYHSTANMDGNLYTFGKYTVQTKYIQK